MSEIWKDVVLKGYNGMYQVSNIGRVRSLDKEVFCRGGKTRVIKGRLLKPQLSLKYNYIVLSNKQVHKNMYIHRLVAMAFLNPSFDSSKCVVDHIDNNPLNNKLSNLQLITQRENTSKNPKSKSSKYTGVRRYRNKWRAEININGKSVYLGDYICELSASKAYNNKLKQFNATL